MPKSQMIVAVLWEQVPKSVQFQIQEAELGGVQLVQGQGAIQGQAIRFEDSGPGRLHLDCRQARVAPGSPTAKITVQAGTGSFSFLLRDVTSACPIIIPEYGTAVIPADDPRTYAQIAETVRQRGGLTKLQRINLEPEEDYATAAAATRRLYGHTILGLSRNMRLFEITSFSHTNQVESVTTIAPTLASYPVRIPEKQDQNLVYEMIVSRGIGCVLPQTRRLEDGRLPILTQRIADEEVIYDLTFFCSLENRPLSREAVRGTHYLVADGHSGGHNFTPEQALAFQERLAEDSSCGAEETLAYIASLKSASGSRAPGHDFTDADRALFIQRRQKAGGLAEEPVLIARVQAVNTAGVPRYAWLTAPRPIRPFAHSYDPETGFGTFESGRVYCVARLNGGRFPNPEIALLLQPGETAEAEFLIPHRPLERARAERLATQPVGPHHDACRAYWRAKLAEGAQVEVPERRIHEMLQAGHLHLELVMYGREPDGVLAPSCGKSYSALGLESFAIIQFLDSMGRHDLARRGLDFFLEKQRADGMIQNFAGHQSEPGPVLWTFAEHYRYTQDRAWLADRAPRLLKTANCLLAWRGRNQRAELRGQGYGLIDGQQADMQECFHGFGLNAVACRGVLALARALAEVVPDEAARLSREALAWKQDLLDAVIRSMELAPVVPLGDGTWTPSLAPWSESDRPACLDGTKKCLTHGTFLTRDNAIPASLVFHGLLEPDDPRAGRLLRYVTDIYHIRNVRHSQPYVSWHPWIHLRRREVKAFLKSYYNTLASLADRETYTFWEHYHGACPHKTEGAAGFLMQTRWMLWLEEGETLTFLPGIPRTWLRPGNKIRLSNAASYFGPVSLAVEAGATPQALRAEYSLHAERRPPALAIRLPHPEGRRPRRVQGGEYDPAAETVLIRNPPGAGEVTLEY